MERYKPIFSEKDDLNKRQKDGDTVSNQDWELRDWAAEMGHTEDQILDAKKNTGSNDPDVIKDYLDNL